VIASRSRRPKVPSIGPPAAASSAVSGATASARQQQLLPSSANGAAVSAAWLRAQARAVVAIADAQRALRECLDTSVIC